MKVKELPLGTDLRGKILKTPKGVVGYFVSQGNGTVILAKTTGVIVPVEGMKDETRMYPQIVGNDEDVLEWDVVEDNTPINCHALTSHQFIMCVKE